MLAPLDPEMALLVQNTMEQMGIEVIVGDGITGFAGTDRATAVKLESPC